MTRTGGTPPVPAEVRFAIKRELAPQMIARPLDTDTSASWVAADEVHGADHGLRAQLVAGRPRTAFIAYSSRKGLLRLSRRLE
jgi:hypothetical protein